MFRQTINYTIGPIYRLDIRGYMRPHDLVMASKEMQQSSGERSKGTAFTQAIDNGKVYGVRFR